MSLMKKKQKLSKIKVLFNASVVLAGLKSPSGGSSKVISFARERTVIAIVSEIILDEVLRNSHRVGFTKEETLDFCNKIFTGVTKAPTQIKVEDYKKIVIDEGDAHILATCSEEKIKYLVTLDKKHLLILKGKIQGLKIVTPGELIEFLATKVRYR